MSRVIGIDLGTTNSCAAVMEGDTPVVIPTAEGGGTTPSVVTFSEAAPGGYWVGQSALRQAAIHPESSIHSIKRLMGRRLDDPEVRRHRLDCVYPVVAGPGGEAWVRAGGEDHSPAEISALILAELKRLAEAHLREPVTGAVISVPAYFDHAQRLATRDAARMAGLQVLRIVNEPTAAVLAYGVSAGSEENVAVYDLGAGTFDITLLRASEGEIEVMATAGDGFLGGDDFDQRLVNHLADLFQKETAVDLRRDAGALHRLKVTSEAAKRTLSQTKSTRINMMFPAPYPRPLVTTLTRAKLESATRDLVERTIFRCEAALSDAGWTAADVGAVLLVGGQTRMPRVREQVVELFGRAPREDVDPDEAVARGAALLGAEIEGMAEPRKVVEVTALSIGVETAGGVFTRIIQRNSPLPATRSQIFSTAADNQERLTIHVVQGEREMAADNKSLGHFRVADIPPAPRGLPQIAVVLDVDADGLLSVSARNVHTGQQQAVEVAHPPAQGG